MSLTVNMGSICLALLALCACVTRAAAAPGPRVESVEAAANRTLCPYIIEMDEDPARDPQRIKVIKCLSPDKHAPVHRHHGHAQSCSDVRAATQRAHCTELHDVVRVRYGARSTAHDVAVGCACAFLEHGTAREPADALR